jgi:hypothetical protein
LHIIILVDQTNPLPQLALATVFLSLGGSLARVFTTFKELGTDDPQLVNYALACTLSGILFLQVRGVRVRACVCPCVLCLWVPCVC